MVGARITNKNNFLNLMIKTHHELSVAHLYFAKCFSSIVDKSIFHLSQPGQYFVRSGDLSSS